MYVTRCLRAISWAKTGSWLGSLPTLPQIVISLRVELGQKKSSWAFGVARTSRAYIWFDSKYLSQTCYYHLEDGLDMNDHRQRSHHSHVEDFLVDECLWLMCQGLVTMIHSCEIYWHWMLRERVLLNRWEERRNGPCLVPCFGWSGMYSSGRRGFLNWELLGNLWLLKLYIAWRERRQQKLNDVDSPYEIE